MEFLTPHVILRRALIEGRQISELSEKLGCFLARTLFRGSDLCMDTKLRKADLALFADNVALCDITESLVFSDPYYDAKLNRHTSPQLDGIVGQLRADRDMKVAAQRLKHVLLQIGHRMKALVGRVRHGEPEHLVLAVVGGAVRPRQRLGEECLIHSIGLQYLHAAP